MDCCEKKQKQLWVCCGSTNPSFIWTTSILLLAPSFHSCFLSELHSPLFFLLFSPHPLALLTLTIPALKLSFQPCSLPLAPQGAAWNPSYLFSFLWTKQRENTGSNKTEQQGWDGPGKVIKPHTQTHGSPQGHWGEAPMGWGGHFCLCVSVLRRHFMCSCWEGWMRRPPTFS